MNCDVCGRQIRRKKTNNGNYSHHYYYLDYCDDDDCDYVYTHRYDDYASSSFINDSLAVYDVMVCSRCCIKDRNRIPIPRHIPKQQYKIWLIETLDNR